MTETVTGVNADGVKITRAKGEPLPEGFKSLVAKAPTKPAKGRNA